MLVVDDQPCWHTLIAAVVALDPQIVIVAQATGARRRDTHPRSFCVGKGRADLPSGERAKKERWGRCSTYRLITPLP
jgi:hypothetical protein